MLPYVVVTVVSLLLYSLLWLVHFGVSAVLAVIALPLVFAIHLKYKPESDRLKAMLVENDRFNQENNYNIIKELQDLKRCTAWYGEVCSEKIMRRMLCRPDSGVSCAFIKENNHLKPILVNVFFVNLNDGKRAKLAFFDFYDIGTKCLVFSDSPQGWDAYDAFRKLNMFNYQKLIMVMKNENTAGMVRNKCTNTYRVLMQAYQQADSNLIKLLPKEITSLIVVEAFREEAMQVNLDTKSIYDIGMRFGFDPMPKEDLPNEKKLLLGRK